MGWGSFLLALTGPIARRVMVSLGLSVVTFTGVSVAVDSLLAQARSAWAGAFLGDAAQLVAMAGVNTGLSIIAGGIIGRVTMMAIKRIQVV